METLGRNLIKVEFHQLEMPLAQSQMQDPSALQSLVSSIEKFGQVDPALVAKNGEALILLEGYQLIEALRKCGKDTVWVEQVSCDLASGLLLVLARNQSRHLEPLEEAHLIERLITDHGKTGVEVAQALGRDPSWVSRRLEMLRALPEPVLSAIRQGQIGPWTANRVLAPLARANPDHAVQLLEALEREPLSSRDLEVLFKQYKTAPKKTRERMIRKPHLFLRVYRMDKNKREAEVLRGGPEEAWLQALGDLGKSLEKLRAKTDVLVMAGAFEERDDLLKAFDQVASQWNELEEIMNRSKDETTKVTGNDFEHACSEDPEPEDLPAAESPAEPATACEEKGEKHEQASRANSCGSRLDSQGHQQPQRQSGSCKGSSGNGTPPDPTTKHPDPHDSRGPP